MATVLTVAGKSPQLGQRVFLAPTASITGDVTMEDDASAFYGVSVRADTNRIVIGQGTNLQDNVAVHVDADSPCLLGRGISVGHGAVVHGCEIGDSSLVGMNAVVLSHSKIGAETLIAAGTVVLEGSEIPPRSLVAGVPGKVRRQLTDEEVAALHRNAETYLELKEQHIDATAAA